MSTQQELEYQRRLREEIEETLFLQRSFTDEALQAAKAVLGMGEGSKKTSQAFRGISNVTNRIANEMKEVVMGMRDIDTLEKTKIKRNEAIVELMTQSNLAIDQILFSNQNLNATLKNQLDPLLKSQAIQDAILAERNNLTDNEIYLLELYADQFKALSIQEEQIKEITRQAEEMRKLTGGMFGIAEGANEVLKKLGGGKFSEALGITDAVSKSKQYAKELLDANNGVAKAGDKFRVMGNLVGNLGKNLLKSLGPLTLITQFVQGLLQADKETTELQKSMALTKGEAVGFRMELMNAAGATGDINITSSKLLETFGALNKQFGFITNFATDTLVTMTKLTGVVGVSSESAGNLAAASEVTGTSFESNYKDVLATSYELQRQSGVQMDLRDILEQTGKVTGTVRANLGANPAQIAKAITQAKLFGASLEQVANAGKSMLDFEASITAELEAELLLGKNINLERARAAALAGDQVTLAQELQKEAGTFSDFTKMNVIQQEALAKAMGMTSDQLADILFQQEVQGKSAKELRALGKEELADRVEAQSMQTKLNAAIEKMQNLFVDLASGLTPVLFVLGKALSIVGLIAGMIQDLISGVGMLFGMDMPESSATVGALKNLFGMETMDDGVIPTGYGETIIKKGKDTIALNNNDQTAIVAGTNLGGSSQSTPVQDNTETKRTNQLLESSVQALHELTKLSARPSVFQIGTDNFYTATSKYSYQVQ
jgi:hypothetical protein